MNPRAYGLLAVAICLAVTGCTPVSADLAREPSNAHYYDARLGCAFDYPDDWTRTPADGALILDSPDSKAHIRVSASSQDPVYEEESMKRIDALAHIEEETLTMQPVSCDASARVGGFWATDVVYVAEEVLSGAGRGKRKGRQVLVYAGGTVYDLDLVARVEAFDAANADFNVLIGSFRVK